MSTNRSREEGTGKQPRRASYDAVVVGARCAGAATAMLLARAGLEVLVVERGRYGSDTLSTHALMRGAVLQLSRWGLLERLRATGVPAVRSTTFYYGDRAVEIPIVARDGVDALHAPRRTVLDALLVDAAREAGAEIRYGVSAVDLVREESGAVRGLVIEDGSGERRSIAAGIVIGADGLRSVVARLVGAPTALEGHAKASVVYGYWHGPAIENYRFYYRPGVSAGAIPTHDGHTCIFASMPPRRFRDEISRDIAAGYRRVLAECSPELADEVERARSVSSLRGFPGEYGHLRQCQGDGWALVGDAGYFKDPLTAHGITDALRDAELLARAVVAGTERALRAYEVARNALVERFMRITDEVASFKWDLDRVQRLHVLMSREMGKEVETILRLDALDAGESVGSRERKGGTKAA